VLSVPSSVSIFALEAEHGPQWLCEGGTSESEKSKKVGMTRLLIGKSTPVT
jgi:hypothetical protein